MIDALFKRETAMNVTEVMATIGISRTTLYKLIADEELPAVRIGGAVRFDPADVATFLRDKKKGPRPEAQPETIASTRPLRRRARR